MGNGALKKKWAIILREVLYIELNLSVMLKPGIILLFYLMQLMIGRRRQCIVTPTT